MSFTFVEAAIGTYGANLSSAATLTNAVAVGDLLVAIPYIYTSTATNQLSTLGCTDTVNTGNYTFPSQVQIYSGSSSPSTAASYIKCNTAGTPTVTMTMPGNAGEG